MLRLADRHRDGALPGRWRDPGEQRAQPLERIRGQKIETRIHGESRRARDYSDAIPHGRILADVANFLAFAMLAVVLAYWGWRWFGPAPVHIPVAPVQDVGATLAASPPFGAPPSSGTPAVAAPTQLTGDTRLLGVLSEPGGRGRALFRLADGSARLVSAGDALSGDARLVSVRPDGVTIRDASGERNIVLRAQPAVASAAPRRAATQATCAIPPGFKGPVIRLAGELVQGLIQQPDALRAMAEGQGNALVIRDESGFAALLGMKKGDRVAQANGIALRAPEDVVVAVLRPLAASQPVRLVGVRGSETREMMILNASVCPG
jgi:hypothetical protein